MSTQRAFWSKFRSIFPRFNWKVGLILLAVGAIFAFAPQRSDNALAEDCQEFQTPVFNPFPIVYGDPGLACVDFPLVRAKLENGQYPRNDAEQAAGVTAHAGDVVDVLVYFHNGAIVNGDPNVTTAFNVAVGTNIDTAAAAEHRVKIALRADNAATIRDSIFIHTNANESLEIIPGSGQRFDFRGNLVQSGFSIDSNGEFSLGDLRACFEFSGFVKFKMRVKSPPIQQVICAPHNQTVDMNVPALFTASGGNGVFSWSAPGGNPSSGSGSNFSASYNSPGQKTVTVSSGGLSDTCAVNVNQPPQVVGCIDVIKETFNTQGQPITPVAQFIFRLDGGATAVNDSGGHARFNNVSAGTHAVTESVPSGWQQLLVTPAGGVVEVFSGPQCATVVFKNQQNQIPQPNPVDCSPSFQSADINETVFFSASGGNGVFSWSAPGGIPSSGSSSSFQTKYSTSGQKIVTVTSNGTNDTCAVQVNQIVVNPVDCSPSFQSVNVGQTANFFASGGNGVFSWSAPSGNPSSGSSSQFSTSYSTSGSKTVTVSSSGTSDTCGVQVNQIVNAVECTPSFQSGDVNQTMFFSASGGNGVFSWSAPSGNPSSGSGSTFNTSYSTSGQRNVTVTSSGTSDICGVSINQNAGNLNITKHVRNQTRGTSFAKQTTAEDGERVEYRVVVTANNGTVNNVQLSENLPSHLTLVSGSGRLDGQTISDSFINNFISVGTMTSGQSRVLTFQARAFGASGQSQTVIINTATVFGSGVGSLSDSATVFINRFIGDGFGELSIEKQVRNITQSTSLRNSVNADNDDEVQFEIRVRNTGSETVDNVRVTDSVPSSLDVDTDSIDADDLDDDNSSGNRIDLDLGDLRSGESRRIRFEARVNSTSSRTIQNIARATGDGVSRIEDDAFVFVDNDTTTTTTGNPNLIFSKRAHNDTKNVDATTTLAAREDFITYTLTVTNTGNARANNFTITDDLSGVLPFADMVDRGGGSLSGNTITFSSVDIPAGGSISKSFRARVKFFLSAQQTFVMTNTYGNTVTITIPPIPGQPRFIAPKTGAGSGMAAIGFAGLLTGGFALMRRRGKQIIDFIWK